MGKRMTDRERAVRYARRHQWHPLTIDGPGIHNRHGQLQHLVETAVQYGLRTGRKLQRVRAGRE